MPRISTSGKMIPFCGRDARRLPARSAVRVQQRSHSTGTAGRAPTQQPTAYQALLLAAVIAMLPVFTRSLHAQSPASRRDADIRTMMGQASRLQLAGKYEPALAKYEAAYDLARSRVSAAALLGRIFFGMGQCQEQLGRYDKALARYLQTAEPGRKGPYADDALLRAGEVAELAMESFSRARGLYERLQSEHPSSPLAGIAALQAARTLEQEGRFEEALQAYEKVALVRAGRKECRAVVGQALEAARFIRENRGDDYQALKSYRRCERLAGRVKTRNAALRELIRLTGRYDDSPLVDDALVLMIRIHLAKAEPRGARETFDRLVALKARTLSAEAVRAIAVRAAGWLLSDIDTEVARVVEVFPELAAYGRGEGGWPVPNMVTRNADGQWVLRFTNGGPTSPRRLELRIVVGPATRDRPAVYPALGLYHEANIDTANEVLSAELKRMIERMTDALAMLDRAAYVRSEVDADEAEKEN